LKKKGTLESPTKGGKRVGGDGLESGGGLKSKCYGGGEPKGGTGYSWRNGGEKRRGRVWAKDVGHREGKIQGSLKKLKKVLEGKIKRSFTKDHEGAAWEKTKV